MFVHQPLSLILCAFALLAPVSTVSGSPLSAADCSSCLAETVVPFDPDFNVATGANVTISIAPASSGTCDPDNGCAHLDPCTFAYSQIVNVGIEGGQIGYLYHTYDQFGVKTAAGTRSNLPPGGSDVTHSQVDVGCATAFDYSITVVTATTQTTVSAIVIGGCNPCTEIIDD